MKAAYEMMIPCCPVPGQLTSIQPPCNIFDLSTWSGIFIDFCVNSLSQIGHLMLWSCFLEPLFNIMNRLYYQASHLFPQLLQTNPFNSGCTRLLLHFGHLPNLRLSSDWYNAAFLLESFHISSGISHNILIAREKQITLLLNN
jgi:hypothetical protein